MKAGGQPGSVYRLELQECAQNSCIASMHGFDIRRVCALASRETLPEIIVIGIEPQKVDWSLDLTEQVAQALPHILSAVERELL
jgi:hydrogenase maturation protease